jgi:hypothetical protein
MQRAQGCPDDEVQDEKRANLVERANEAVRRQPLQEQQLETTG